jgi:hypothetical protein
LDECNTEVGIFLSGKECVKSCDAKKILSKWYNWPLK